MTSPTEPAAPAAAAGVIAALARSGDAVAASTGRDIFVTALLASTGASELPAIAAPLLAAEVAAAFAWLTEKPAGTHKVQLRASKLTLPGAPGELAVLEILNDDMPFLLDSVLAEIQARGHRAHFALHPIFKTRRRPGGQLEAVTAPGDRSWDDGRQESYIAVHIEMPDEAAKDAEGAALVAAVSESLDQVRLAVRDWKPMMAQLERSIRDLEAAAPAVQGGQLSESIAFLQWLSNGNFTFLGSRDLALSGNGQSGELEPVSGSGLGLLRDANVQVLRRGRDLVSMTPEVRRFFFNPNPLIITKANVISRVHRHVHMDYVGVKHYGANGKPVGELRLIGLFTSSVYTQPARQIPLLRHKVDRVVEASGFPPESHAGKALINVLETFPRDELFQIGMGDLKRWTAGILDLEIRPRVRVFRRIDRFDRFVSILVYVPRDRFSTTVRERIGTYLAERFAGVVTAFYPTFTEAPLVRVHFIIARHEGVTPDITEAELELGVAAIVRTWDDQLSEVLRSSAGLVAPNSVATSAARTRLQRYVHAFSAGYAETFPVERALEDIQRIERLGPDRSVAIDFYRNAGDPPSRVHAAIYRYDTPMRLSDRVPVLENLGLSVIDERTYTIRPQLATGPRDVVLHDMALETADGVPFDIGAASMLDVRLEDCFLAAASGEAENDGFNRLVIASGVTWREAAVLRAYAGFLRQLGSAFGLRYVADTVVRHAGITRDLIEFFMLRFDCDQDLATSVREDKSAPVLARIEGALAKVDTLDEDRILRQLLKLIRATVRTNFFQVAANGQHPETIAFKFNGRELDMAPQPRSYREIWVSSPRIDAVHLRFAPIARGGIRWSDRALDFRTEVLGLAKAQQVKNAVIVPAGAKGGFIPKLLPRAGTRDAIAAEGIGAYTVFISAMLDITDNIVDGAVVPPARVVRYDGDDPYLVVAADKGTATFSDTANELAKAHGYWLADAFASGGSAGYDHKKLAITSRGAWECVKRHFREMDRDIQKEPFRVVGVGDMSGDVFGNGMLRSEAIRLIAAFDHRDIFLDPDPNAPASFAERTRLFALPRSSWADYDRTLISRGGGVFSRNAKSVPLSGEVRAMLGLDAESLAPQDLIHAILLAECDLLFFGGIGTYVRASTETEQDVGDRANDGVRVAASELHAKVIGEGANLGMTQRARVEASGRGIRLNTDFIDNSAGVNTSDQEVNIKIALAPVIAAGGLTIERRNELLKEMAGDVAAAVLRNNYQQSLGLSLAARRAPGELAANARLIRSLEARGLLDRRLEALPPEREIAERQRGGKGFVRPELAILSSYAKIALLHDLLASTVPDDPGMQALLIDYFPQALQKAFPAALAEHRLRREIIATTLTNGLVNRLGAATPLQLASESAQPIAQVAYAFMAARGVFDLADLWRRIDGLDGHVKGELQLELYERVRALLVRATAFFLRSGVAARDLQATVVRHRAGLAEIRDAIGAVGPAASRARQAALQSRLIAEAVPADIADDVALLPLLTDAPVMIETALATQQPLLSAAQVFLDVGDRFRLDDIVERAQAIRTADDYDRLAIASATTALLEAQRAIAVSALALGDGGGAAIEPWLEQRLMASDRVIADLAEISGAGELTVSRMTVAASRLSDLARMPPA